MEKQIENNEPLNFEKVWFMFQETDKKFQETRELLDKKFSETDKKFLETDKKFSETRDLLDKKFSETRELLDKKFQETDREFEKTRELLLLQAQESDKRFKETNSEITGIGKSNGLVAEDFFYTALNSTYKVGKMNFDFISKNVAKEKRMLKAEYDIVLYNDYKVLVEVKYNFKQKYLQKFYQNIKNFKPLFPEFKTFKIYGAIAGMTFEDKVMSEAKEYGFYILKPNNENILVVNENDFEPHEIK